MAEPTIAEASRLMLRLTSAGTVRRLEILHAALSLAYRTGEKDALRRADGMPEAESCLEG